MTENEISNIVIGCAIKVHRELGPGLLESAYIHCLAYELHQTGLPFEREKPIPLIYQGIKMDCGYRADLIVEEKVIIEAKAIASLEDIHIAQVMTYLKLTQCRLGMLINFNVRLLKDGIKRVVLNL